jgi:hypothetical protein
MEGKVASNETFSAIEIPEAATFGSNRIRNLLEGPVSDVITNGYRFGEGIDAERYPSETVMREVEGLHMEFNKETPMSNAFTQFARGDISYDAYIGELKGQLDRQGGRHYDISDLNSVIIWRCLSIEAI